MRLLVIVVVLSRCELLCLRVSCGVLRCVVLWWCGCVVCRCAFRVDVWCCVALC